MTGEPKCEKKLLISCEEELPSNCPDYIGKVVPLCYVPNRGGRNL
jgi:hypothetical protein